MTEHLDLVSLLSYCTTIIMLPLKYRFTVRSTNVTNFISQCVLWPTNMAVLNCYRRNTHASTSMLTVTLIQITHTCSQSPCTHSHSLKRLSFISLILKCSVLSDYWSVKNCLPFLIIYLNLHLYLCCLALYETSALFINTDLSLAYLYLLQIFLQFYLNNWWKFEQVSPLLQILEVFLSLVQGL